MRIALKDIKSNPYRNLSRYPLNAEKVVELVRSIQATEAGFWDNCVVRKTKDGYELAYGHARLEAAKRAGLKDADFIVKSLPDADMLKVMLLENRGDLDRGQINVIMEAVEALVGAIARGEKMVEIDPSTNKQYLRYAPSYVAGAPAVSPTARPYTLESVASFLSETAKVRDGVQANQALSAVVNVLEQIELRNLTRAEVDAIPTLDALQRKVREGKERQARKAEEKRVREREEAARAELDARLAKDEEKRKQTAKDAAAAKKESEANLRELTEEIRIAQEEKDRATAKQVKAKLAEAEKAAALKAIRDKEEMKKIDAKIAADKKAAADLKAKQDAQTAKRAEPVLPVEEPERVPAEDVLVLMERLVDRALSVQDDARAIKQRKDDLLTLKRIASKADELQKVANWLVKKFAPAKERGE
jgi:ParB-like nuclease domain